MGQIKLKTDFRNGILEVEGDEQFVKTIYDQFSQHVTASNLPNHSSPSQDMDGSGNDLSIKPKPKAFPKPHSEKANSSSTYKPSLDKNLDTSKLKEFIAKFEMKNHAEKILVIAKFLENIGLAPCNFDQIYTCYIKGDLKVPTAFVQAIRDCSGKSFGYVDFDSTKQLVSLSIAGNNHFNHDIQKKVTGVK